MSRFTQIDRQPKRQRLTYRQKRIRAVRRWSICSIILMLLAAASFFMAGLGHDEGAGAQFILTMWVATVIFGFCSLGCLIRAGEY